MGDVMGLFDKIRGIGRHQRAYTTGNTDITTLPPSDLKGATSMGNLVTDITPLTPPDLKEATSTTNSHLLSAGDKLSSHSFHSVEEVRTQNGDSSIKNIGTRGASTNPQTPTSHHIPTISKPLFFAKKLFSPDPSSFSVSRDSTPRASYSNESTAQTTPQTHTPTNHTPPRLSITSPSIYPKSPLSPNNVAIETESIFAPITGFEVPVNPDDIVLGGGAEDISPVKDTRAPTSISDSVSKENSGFERQSSSDSSADGASVRKGWKNSLENDINAAVQTAISNGAKPEEIKDKVKKVLSATDKLSKGSKKDILRKFSEDVDAESSSNFGGSSLGDDMSDWGDTQSTFDNPLYEDGKALARKGQYKEAITCYKKALESEEKPQYYHKIAISYYFLNKMKEAEEFCTEALATDPNYCGVYQTFSSIYRQKYSKNKVDNPELATTYKLKAEKYLKRYKETTDLSLKDQVAWIIEKILMLIEEGECKNVKEYLTKVCFIIKKQKELIPDIRDYDMAQKNQRYDSQLELIKKITSFIEIPVASTSSTTTCGYISGQWTPEIKEAVQYTLERFKLSLQQEQLLVLTNQMNKQIAYYHHKFDEFKKQCVTKAEVSTFIEENPLKELHKQQMQMIESDSRLNEYFREFVKTIYKAYNTSIVVTGGSIALDTNTLALTIAQQLLNLIPTVGHAVSTGVTSAVVFAKESNMKHDAFSFETIAMDSTELRERIIPIARAITLSPTKKAQILSAENEEVKGFFAQAFSLLDSGMKRVEDKICRKICDTPAKRLGYMDACELIAKYVKIQKESDGHSQLMNVKEAIEFITTTIIPDFHSQQPGTPSQKTCSTSPKASCTLPQISHLSSKTSSTSQKAYSKVASEDVLLPAGAPTHLENSTGDSYVSLGESSYV